jgi:argininosuccinate synthase
MGSKKRRLDRCFEDLHRRLEGKICAGFVFLAGKQLSTKAPPDGTSIARPLIAKRQVGALRRVQMQSLTERQSTSAVRADFIRARTAPESSHRGGGSFSSGTISSLCETHIVPVSKKTVQHGPNLMHISYEGVSWKSWNEPDESMFRLTIAPETPGFALPKSLWTGHR